MRTTAAPLTAIFSKFVRVLICEVAGRLVDPQRLASRPLAKLASQPTTGTGVIHPLNRGELGGSTR